MRMFLLTLPLAASLAGCATEPTSWHRIDGQADSPTSLAAAETICQGEREKANLTDTERPAFYIGHSPLDDVYAGCMASHGYLKGS